MSNKGFSLAEMIATLLIISILSVTIVSFVGNTLSINKEKACEIMKNNIISVSYDYINECDNGINSCSYIWVDNKTSFSVSVLKDSGYINNLESPINDKDLSYCLTINATKYNGIVDINLKDECN